MFRGPLTIDDYQRYQQSGLTDARHLINRKIGETDEAFKKKIKSVVSRQMTVQDKPQNTKTSSAMTKLVFVILSATCMYIVSRVVAV